MPHMLPASVATSPTALSADDAIGRARERLKQADEAGAIAVFASVAPAAREPAFRQWMESVAGEDPWRAARLALAAESPLQEAGLAVAVPAMLERDETATLRWAATLSDPQARFQAMDAVARKLVERDPAAAVGRLLALPPAAERTQFLTLIAMRWARTDVERALAWAREVSPEDLRTQIITAVAFEIARTTPQRAVELTSAVPEGRERRLLYSVIGQTWVARDPAAALAWARQLPIPAAREAALSGIETGLGVGSARIADGREPAFDAVGGAGRSPADPRDVAALSPSAERERALRKKFDDLLLASPRLAADWLGSLPPGDQSDELLQRLAREWLAQNPAAAETWLDQNVVSRPRRDQLLQEARR